MNTLSHIEEIIAEYGSFEAYEQAKINEPTNPHLVHLRNGFDFTVSYPAKPAKYYVDVPLEDPSILLTGGCHVDHEGFDLNEIEQAYYKAAGISMTKDATWYKDGDGERATNAILQPWIEQTNKINFDGQTHFIVDHSHFVFKYPILGAAARQIAQYVPQRPELLRLLSTRFKCGLDLCIDLIHCDIEKGSVESFVHIEWDFSTFDDMSRMARDISHSLKTGTWHNNLETIKNFNKQAILKEMDAFTLSLIHI